jgi:hypothetical protein
VARLARQVNNEMAREEGDRDPTEGTLPASIRIKKKQGISVKIASCVAGDLE